MTIGRPFVPTELGLDYSPSIIIGFWKDLFPCL